MFDRYYLLIDELELKVKLCSKTVDELRTAYLWKLCYSNKSQALSSCLLLLELCVVDKNVLPHLGHWINNLDLELTTSINN